MAGLVSTLLLFADRGSGSGTGSGLENVGDENWLSRGKCRARRRRGKGERRTKTKTFLTKIGAKNEATAGFDK